MKINAEQFLAKAPSKLAPVYLVTGLEILLQNQVCDNIRHIAKTLDFTERELLTITPRSFDWSQLKHAQQSLSLFAEKKIIELRFPTDTINKEASTALLEYLKQTNHDQILLIMIEKLSAATARSKLLKTIEEQGVVIHCWPITAERMPAFIKSRAQHHQLTLSPETTPCLVEHYQGNCLALEQMLATLSLAYSQQTITLELLAQAVSDQSHFDVFALADSVLTVDVKHSLHMLKQLLASGTVPTLIFWAIVKDWQILAQLLNAKYSQQQCQAILKQAGVWQRRINLFRQTVQRLPANAINTIQPLVWQCEQAIKGLNPNTTFEQSLSQYILAIAANPLNLPQSIPSPLAGEG